MIATILVLSLFISTLSGCGYYKADTKQSEQTKAPKTIQYYDSSETVAEETKEATVHILIDQAGYACNDPKKAIFVGEDLSGSFSVIDVTSKQEVFAGTMTQKGQSELLGATVWEGDFSSLSKAGSYYIATEKLGQSYAFEIENQVYKARSEELYGQIKQDDLSKQEKLEQSDVIAISNMLFAYEVYRNEEQNASYFKPYVDYIAKQELNEMLTEAQRYLLCGLMAQLANTYQQIDKAEAQAYLARAKALYAQGKSPDSEEAYFAAAQLYKASGDKRYQSVLQQQLKKRQESVSENEIAAIDVQFLGDIAYLTTAFTVDQSICEQLMRQCLTKAEAISVEAGKSMLRMTDETNTNEIYMHMMLLAIVDYAIVSYEYLSLMKEDIHYLYGKGNLQDLSDLSFEEQSYLYFILEHITHREESHS